MFNKFKPLRYNMTCQWSDRHEAYIGFVAALIPGARMFLPDLDLVGVGATPDQALLEGIAKAQEYLLQLSKLAILPPREEITPTTEFIEKQVTVNERQVTRGNR